MHDKAYPKLRSMLINAQERKKKDTADFIGFLVEASTGGGDITLTGLFQRYRVGSQNLGYCVPPGEVFYTPDKIKRDKRMYRKDQ